MPEIEQHSLRSSKKPGGKILGEADARWVGIYRAMRSQRIIDEKMTMLQRQGRIAFYGATTGQEAATIGSVAALDSNDWVVPALREAAAALYRGLPLDLFVAQHFGNSYDMVKGRQMPCHFTWKKGHYVSMSSCVGTQLPHAVGIAMAARYRKDPAVVLAYLGEGATSTGDFHAAMNLAGVYRAPVVFFCQNNQWAISVPASKQTASETFAEKAEAYGFKGIRVDGNDAVAVYETTRKAVDSARKGQGPTLIEALTYRMGGHTTSDDPSRYRDERECKAWEKKDPIARMRKFLEGKRLWNASQETALVKEFTAKLALVVEKVEKAPPVPLESMFEDVYAHLPAHLSEQLGEARFREGRE